MGKNNFIKSRPLSIGQQQFAMQEYFPQFEFFHGKSGFTWKGWLKPNEESDYLIKMVYNPRKRPLVWVLSPEIEFAPHLYPDNSLCLYYPKDRSWKPELFLATHIIPWTAEWLAFYEIWTVTGIWYGEEAPHRRRKI